MKLTAILIMVSTFGLLASETYAQSKRLTLKMENAKVEDVLANIQKQSEFYFFVYSEKVIDADRRVTVNLEEQNIETVLQTVFAGTDVAYLINDRLIVLTTPEVLGKVSPAVAQQQPAVSGKVTDESGQPLPGVTIVIKGTTQGTVTNANGEYSISSLPEDATLVFSFVGMRTQEVLVGNQTNINVRMEEETIGIEEVVAIGYGTQIKEAVSGSVGTVQGSQLAEQPVIQTSASLMGLIPGVQVSQTSGQPGRNTGDIKIRGIGTLSNSNPLVLIDGVSGNMDDIPSSDIENISVLKDASAAAIYGSRGANGVILITTKRGGLEPLRVNYTGQYGFGHSTNLPGFVDGGSFMKLENLAADNLGFSHRWSDEYIQQWEANYKTDPDNYPNVDWIKEVFSETANQQTHNLSIYGGDQVFKYRGSLQYDDEDAEIKNYRYQRYNIRLNTDVKASDDFSFKFDINAIRTNSQEPSQGLELITRQAFRLDPLNMSRFSDGSLARATQGGRNAVAYLEEGGLGTITRNIFRGNFVGIYSPLSSLKFSITYAPNISMSWNKNMKKQYTIIHPETQDILEISPAKNELNERFDQSIQHSAIFTANYQKDFADHVFNILGGSEYIDYSDNYFSAYRDNFKLQDFEQLNSGSAANMQNSGSASQWKLLSFFGRLDYNYGNKYLFLTNLRYDGSSRFIGDNRWSFFPSFSLAWRISEESFMETVRFLNDLKIRGSWGVIGNQQIGNYPFAAVINLGQDFIFGGNVVDGASQLSLANSEITWETTTTKNIGFDMSLFDSKIDLTLDLFERVTDDILLTLPLPQIVGMNPPYKNAGVVKNTGWEFQVGYNNNLGKDFLYSLNFNISDVKNEVVDLYETGPFISGNSITKEGYPINSIYGYVSDGLFKSQQEIDNHATQTGAIAPGDIKYVDIEPDGIITGADRDIIGDPFPHLNYGLNLSASYKNVYLSAFIQGVGSRDVLLQGDAIWAFQNAGNIRPWMVDSYWRPESPNNTYPRLTRTTDHNNFRATDFWVYDASYLRLRNLQVGFKFPEQWINNGFADQVKVYFVGQNLVTLFNKMPPGIDPNVPNNTVGSFFPVTRLYSFGIDIIL